MFAPVEIFDVNVCETAGVTASGVVVLLPPLHAVSANAARKSGREHFMCPHYPNAGGPLYRLQRNVIG